MEEAGHWTLHAVKRYLHIVTQTPQGLEDRYVMVSGKSEEKAIKVSFKDTKAEITPSLFRIYTRRVSMPLRDEGRVIQDFNVGIVDDKWARSIALRSLDAAGDLHSESYTFDRNENLTQFKEDGVEKTNVSTKYFLNDMVRGEFDLLAQKLAPEASDNLMIAVDSIKYLQGKNQTNHES